jgi:hypothetical protein
MYNLYELLFQKLFPTASVDELKSYRDTLEPSNYEMYQVVSGAMYSKEYKLFALTDKELNQLGEDNSSQQRYMRRTEDAISDSSDDNKKGFYEAWEALEKEEEGIQFEVLRRKFLDKREDIGSS